MVLLSSFNNLIWLSNSSLCVYGTTIICPGEKEQLMKKIQSGDILTPKLTLSGYHPTVRFNSVDNLISNIDFCDSLN